MLNTVSSSKLATSAYRSQTHTPKKHCTSGYVQENKWKGFLWLGFDDGEKLRSSLILRKLVIE